MEEAQKASEIENCHECNTPLTPERRNMKRLPGQVMTCSLACTRAWHQREKSGGADVIVAAGGKGGDGPGGKGGEGGVVIIAPRTTFTGKLPDDYPDSPQGLIQENTDLKKRNAELEAELELLRGERESIARYLEHVADVQVGSLLSEHSLVVVGWCSSWIRNRLDVKWAQGMRGLSLVATEEVQDG